MKKIIVVFLCSSFFYFGGFSGVFLNTCQAYVVPPPPVIIPHWLIYPPKNQSKPEINNVEEIKDPFMEGFAFLVGIVFFVVIPLACIIYLLYFLHGLFCKRKDK